MSLQVWLPLNGNLNNQGLSDVAISNSGAAIDDSGKIGKCYSFDGSDDYISITSNSLYNIIKGGASPFSLSMWLYRADSTRAILFGDYNLSGAINFNVELTTSNAVRFYWGASPDLTFSSAVVVASAWNHIVVTYDGIYIKCYINGELKQTSTTTLATKSKTSGAYYLGRDSRTGTTALNGKMNDFRIYDHCLSPKEVKEISKGLCLHYPLNNPYVEGTVNFIGNNGRDFSGWSSYGFGSNGLKTIEENMEPAISGQVCKVTSSGSTSQKIEMATWVTGRQLALNEKVTLSAYVKGSESTVGKSGFIHVYNNNGTTVQSNTVKNFTFTDDWQRVEGAFTWNQEELSNSSFSIYVVGIIDNGESFYFSNVQLEIGDHATPYTESSRDKDIVVCDCSGFGNNGTISGSISLSSDSPRYSKCAKFETSTTISHSISLDNSGQEWTVSAWVYPTSNTAGQRLNNFNKGNSIFYNTTQPLLYLNDGDNDYYIYGTSNCITLNQWNHIVYVFKNSTGFRKIYVNGIDKSAYGPNKTSTPSGIPSTVIIGQNFVGYMSDYREYATALSETDIKELYNIGASIDNQGNLFCGEVVE